MRSLNDVRKELRKAVQAKRPSDALDDPRRRKSIRLVHGMEVIVDEIVSAIAEGKAVGHLPRGEGFGGGERKTWHEKGVGYGQTMYYMGEMRIGDNEEGFGLYGEDEPAPVRTLRGTQISAVGFLAPGEK
ncbi:hypothetical protein M422DRAFT_268997 [Sphaerobolus stellatus SS14]|uniref:Uncharacterized protein n=1 Tax=Sphaerobolus stellatus (strain SS14) TaxID=990650 RepID=A0A0C9UL68_SPHS4|nr:hypothetical protein M422DRAFT_268997 [Sphaerobolus stellatus SS14]